MSSCHDRSIYPSIAIYPGPAHNRDFLNILTTLRIPVYSGYFCTKVCVCDIFMLAFSVLLTIVLISDYVLKQRVMILHVCFLSLIDCLHIRQTSVFGTSWHMLTSTTAST